MLRFVSLLTISIVALTVSARRPLNLAQKMDSAGMVDVCSMRPGLLVSMMYSRPDNFTGATIYTDGSIDRKVYLHPKAAAALCRAVDRLKATRPDLRLLVKDASRPMSAQRRMYKVVRATPMAPYVSNPANGGGLHNYGLAVDITLADSLGNELPMGTPVDHLGSEANIDKEELLVSRGVITSEERANRLLLRNIMRQAGFTPLRSEWWHFNLTSRAAARREYKLLDF
ncbi:MAG: M15 family metallopeptidase [Paramuribaculum sp.]|nr:M15 family metallopeptidase [Paramuribaculum sp.]